ncbi:nickel-responsive transcriptional regulator NikR [Methanobacterium formicicum]|jgi:CopG family transcriptional regulator, nickel-responsive regulator|uniref:Putative nickel-responsive regulator n=1 Tax=Methanobacterium formicicum (strain DSM 3637 / PP1) TaxID=1204725 RepID=K2R309_METFP|nr:nickel-responsive transcriptional regulator NikR [Methanobacterium formicicum]EKF85622.1 nickel responsive regulator [Methanobacterium formicicum DSM 3637]
MVVERVGVSFEPELLEKFDKLLKVKGYTNRSEAIRDLVRKSIIEAHIESEDEDIVGTLTIIYDHDVGDVTNELQHFQHFHLGEIIATTHVHVEKHACLEVLVVKGKSKSIQKLTDHIKAIKGVKHGELVITKSTV